ncbi:hypothetical protein SK128_006529, partial [Halocaridina rubra]
AVQQIKRARFQAFMRIDSDQRSPSLFSVTKYGLKTGNTGPTPVVGPSSVVPPNFLQTATHNRLPVKFAMSKSK